MAHACVYVWVRMDMWPSAVLPIWPSWSSSILLFIFSFLSRKKKIPNTEPHVSPTQCQTSPHAVWVVQGFDPQNNATLYENEGQVGWGGWTLDEWRVTWVSLHNPSMTSHPPLAVVWPVSLRFFVARWDADGRGDSTVPPAPHSFKCFHQSVKGCGLSLRRCCWRSWMWRPLPFPKYPRRQPTCGCGAWGRGHWPAGAHRCGPPYGRLDSAL